MYNNSCRFKNYENIGGYDRLLLYKRFVNILRLTNETISSSNCPLALRILQ